MYTHYGYDVCGQDRMWGAPDLMLEDFCLIWLTVVSL